MPNVSELISMGFGGYQGWDDASANADYNATGGSGKYTGGAGASGSTIPDFQFDQAAAEQKALAELTPYYEKILAMYGGDVALAKQRIDQDYQTGLRVKTENTEWSKADTDIAAVERKRKYNIALGDLDQTLNSRGIYTSGIRTTERDRAAETEAFNVGQDDRQKALLDKGLAEYQGEADTNLRRDYEQLGYIKPIDQTTTGQFAPDQAGVTAPAGFSISGFKSEPEQKVVAIGEEKKQRAIEMANMDFNKQMAKWQAMVTQAQSLMG